MVAHACNPNYFRMKQGPQVQSPSEQLSKSLSQIKTKAKGSRTQPACGGALALASQGEGRQIQLFRHSLLSQNTAW